jgi:hypothetical protein
MNEEIGQKVFQQVMNIWIIPEIERRKNLGRIDKKFILRGAQIVFSLDWKFPKIRINEEVKAIIEGKPTRDIKKGEAVYEKDLEMIGNIKLTDDDSNCGHITVLRFKDSWIVSFDAHYNQKIRKEYLDASKDFYESAIENLNKKRLRVFYDNAFSSAELCAISILLSWSNKKIINNKRHNQRIEIFKSSEGKKDDYSILLKKLNGIRKSARYLSNTSFKYENPERIKITLKEMINFAEKFL